MTDDNEDLLKAGFFEPPRDFTEGVMSKIAKLPYPEFTPPPKERPPKIQWLALIGTGLLGAAQLAVFMFGIWTATSAG